MKTIYLSFFVICLFPCILSASIYWNYSGGSIQRSNLDGTGMETIVEDSVHGVAVDPVNGRLYWNNPVENAMK